ncbi:MAG: transposase, partial [Thiomonas sp. 13-64-67]
MRSDKLSEERIDEILAILDELKASGMKAEAF